MSDHCIESLLIGWQAFKHDQCVGSCPVRDTLRADTERAAAAVGAEDFRLNAEQMCIISNADARNCDCRCTSGAVFWTKKRPVPDPVSSDPVSHSGKSSAISTASSRSM